MLDHLQGRPTADYSAFVLIGMIAVIGTVLGFQHIGGYVPCQLCLEQRIPYYFAIPIVSLSLISSLQKWPASFTKGLLLLGFMALCVTAAQGVYHSGVEWAWWMGPTECSAALDGGPADAGSLLSELALTKPPSCNEAAGRFLGLSFAGWNVIVAVILGSLALKGATARAQ